MSQYDNVYSIRAYGEMINDTTRFTPWQAALKRHVGPDSVVLDIGCGAGILTFLACQYGARRVFAVEPDASIEVAKLCAAQIPGADRIEWIRGLSTDITLPEQADIVVGDLHGTMPFYAENIASLVDARKRHLKPGGRLLPQRDLLHAVPASTPLEIKSLNAPWRGNPLDLDLTAALPYVVNTWWRAHSNPITTEQLLATPAHWGTVDYTGEVIRALEGDLHWTIERTGQLDGFYAWFDGVVDDDLGFSNSPLLPELVYGRGFFPLQQSVMVEAGDVLQVRLAVKRVQENWIWRWNTRIENAVGERKAAFQQSTFQMLPGQGDFLRKSEAGYVPTLNEDGQVQSMILEHMDGSRPLAEIARELMQRFPAKFLDFDRALAAVVRQSRAHG